MQKEKLHLANEQVSMLPEAQLKAANFRVFDCTDSVLRRMALRGCPDLSHSVALFSVRPYRPEPFIDGARVRTGDGVHGMPRISHWIQRTAFQGEEMGRCGCKSGTFGLSDHKQTGPGGADVSWSDDAGPTRQANPSSGVYRGLPVTGCPEHFLRVYGSGYLYLNRKYYTLTEVR